MNVKYIVLSFLILNSVYGHEGAGDEDEELESKVLIYSPFRWPYLRRDPFRELMELNPFRSIEPLLNSRMDPFLGFRRENPFGDMDVVDNSFRYKTELEGFKPDEVKIKLTGNQLTISGEHKEQDENGTEIVHKTISKTFSLPEGFKRDSIKSVFDGAGNLIITGQLDSKKQPDTVEIPIEIAPSDAPTKTEKVNNDNKEV